MAKIEGTRGPTGTVLRVDGELMDLVRVYIATLRGLEERRQAIACEYRQEAERLSAAMQAELAPVHEAAVVRMEAVSADLLARNDAFWGHVYESLGLRREDSWALNVDFVDFGQVFLVSRGPGERTVPEEMVPPGLDAGLLHRASGRVQ